MNPQGNIRKFINRQVGRVRRGLSRGAGRVANLFGAGRGSTGIVKRSR